MNASSVGFAILTAKSKPATCAASLTCSAEQPSSGELRPELRGQRPGGGEPEEVGKRGTVLVRSGLRTGADRRWTFHFSLLPPITTM
jgi:hypothetical protein